MENDYLEIKLSVIGLHAGFSGGSVGKNPPANAGDMGPIPGLGRETGEVKGYPLQDSGLENSSDCIDHGVAKSRTLLRDFHLHFP